MPSKTTERVAYYAVTLACIGVTLAVASGSPAWSVEWDVVFTALALAIMIGADLANGALAGDRNAE